LNSEQQLARLANVNKIKSYIALADLTYVDIEERFELYTGCVYDTIHAPNEAGEKAIAEALGKKPSELWPERYDADTGLRLSPQPSQNYSKLPSRRERQKTKVA